MSATIDFTVGARVRVFDHQGAFVDDVEVISVKERNMKFLSGDTSVAEVEVRSLQFEPGVVHTMVLVVELGWRVLGNDPLQQGVQCANLNPEAEYDLRLVE
jgi:hypothetical protein